MDAGLSTSDWVLLAVLLVSMVLGFWRGLVHEMLSLAGWLAAFFLAQWLSPTVAVYLPLQSMAPQVQYAAGFVVVFVAVIFLAGLLSWAVGHLLGAVGLRPADRSLGALFGLARGLVILLALAVLVQLAGFAQSPWWQQSQVVPWLQWLLQGLRPVLPPQWQGWVV